MHSTLLIGPYFSLCLVAPFILARSLENVLGERDLNGLHTNGLMLRAAPVETSSPTAQILATPPATALVTDEIKEHSATSTDMIVATPSGRRTSTANDPNHTGVTEYPLDSPAGGIEMITPATTVEPTILYRINDQVTWAWNYTSLLGTPKAVDVFITCSAVPRMWTLTSNMSFAASPTFVWDSGNQADAAENPLLTELYTLVVKDSEAEITARPQPGYLAVDKGLRFGLYKGQSYTPLSQWKCTGCSGASSLSITTATQLAILMCSMFLLSYT